MRFHEKAKKWITSISIPSEQDWVALMEEDINHPYDEFPTTNLPGVDQLQEEIVTEETGSFEKL